MPVKQRDRLSGEGTGETLVLFKTVFVFDRAQVAPIEGAEQNPLDPPREPLTGDSHRHLIAPLRAFTESLGFTVSFEAIDGPAGGWCDSERKRIVVDGEAAPNAQLRILIHETILGLGVGYAEYGRERGDRGEGRVHLVERGIGCLNELDALVQDYLAKAEVLGRCPMAHAAWWD